MEWKDTTVYGKYQTDRRQTNWTIQKGCVKITLTCADSLNPGAWVVVCNLLPRGRVVYAKARTVDVEQAKQNAIAMVVHHIKSNVLEDLKLIADSKSLANLLGSAAGTRQQIASSMCWLARIKGDQSLFVLREIFEFHPEYGTEKRGTGHLAHLASKLAGCGGDLMRFYQLLDHDHRNAMIDYALRKVTS